MTFKYDKIATPLFSYYTEKNDNNIAKLFNTSRISKLFYFTFPLNCFNLWNIHIIYSYKHLLILSGYLLILAMICLLM